MYKDFSLKLGGRKRKYESGRGGDEAFGSSLRKDKKSKYIPIFVILIVQKSETLR